MVKNLPANARDLRDVGMIAGWGRWPEQEMATTQCSSLENPTWDRELGGLAVYRITKSRTWMNYLTIAIYKVFKQG